jgi:ribonuclease D
VAASLELLTEQARARGRIGLDTEFVSEGRYRALLCLVQLAAEADDGSPMVEMIDALGDTDPAPVAALLADPQVEVVVHAGLQDVALVRRMWDVDVRNVFDTQVAAAFSGSSIQAGYETLLADHLGVRVGKSATFTRWDRRPLSEEQLAYARRDVEYLLQLGTTLRERLNELGRVEWVLEESKRVEEASDEPDPEQAFRRLPKVAELSGQGAAVARELAYWREEAAESANRPPRSLVGDTTLVQLARRRPAAVNDLKETRGLREPVIRRHGTAILSALRRGEQAPPIKLERGRPPPEAAEPLVSLAEALVRTRAQEGSLAHQLIASRADLTEIASALLEGRDEPDVRALQGWRRELVGAELLELLHGGRSLSVGADGRLRSSEARS